MKRALTLRFILYGVVLAYLVGDLQLFQGPLHQWLLTKRGHDAQSYEEAGVVAMVYGKPILKSQVKFRMQEYLYKRGRKEEELSAPESPLIFKYCLEKLIMEELVRIKAHFNEKKVSASIIDHPELGNDALQFSDTYERKDALRRQGFSEEELALREKAYLLQRAYLDHVITEEVTAEEIQAFSPPEQSLPERVKLRHLFLSTLEKPAEEVRATLEAGLTRLERGEVTYRQLSTEMNEDLRAKKNEGILDWVSAERIPPEIAEALKGLKVGEGKIIKSTLGLHYLEMTEKKPAQEWRYEEKEVRAYLENKKREAGLSLYLQNLRRRETDKVVILWQPH